MFLVMPIPPDARHSPGDPDPEILFRSMGAMFVVIPAVLIALGWTLAICTIIAGRKLGKHQSYTFCMIMAAVLCAFMPFGTVLGVFTIIVLLRDPVKQLFGVKSASNSYTPSGWQ